MNIASLQDLPSISHEVLINTLSRDAEKHLLQYLKSSEYQTDGNVIYYRNTTSQFMQVLPLSSINLITIFKIHLDTITSAVSLIYSIHDLNIQEITETLLEEKLRHLTSDETSIRNAISIFFHGGGPLQGKKLYGKDRKLRSQEDIEVSYLAKCILFPDELGGKLFSDFLIDIYKTNNAEILGMKSLQETSSHDKDPISQLMVMGPPGTGKSHLLSDRLTALGIDDDSGNVERVVGHPEMTSTDLIGMYRPVSDPGGALRYEFTAGPLIRLLARALQSDEPHVLVIEELNRTNAAATFAEFFQLLDRDEDGKSKYPTQLGVDVNRALGLGEEEKVRFPPNFAIWATVNTADQGVFPMDTAFKRRWTFEYLGVDQDEGVWGDPEQGWNPIIPGYQTLRWQDLRRALNRALENQGVEEDRQLGPFFVSQRELLISEDPPAFLDRLLSKVVAYLRDDVLRHDPALLFVENKGGYVSGFARLRSRARSEGLLSIFNDQLRGELDLSEGELTYHSIYLEWDQYRTLGAPSPELSAEGGVEDQDGAEQSPDLDLAEDQS